MNINMLQVHKHLPEILILLFLAITFMQSALDKIFDWSGNRDYFQDHFSKAIASSGFITFLLFVVTALELVSGIYSVLGLVGLIFYDSSVWALTGTVLSSVTLLFLLLGQRIAKDYAGALTIVCYFIVAVFGVFLLT
ncbi:DoxX family membrane protein [Leptobacterium sp. I13]|uniref:DoxX family membrane protein n=1 Tax=Leptobacterium meishanense TaxID=3128904 RepID=UPI0030EBF867